MTNFKWRFTAAMRRGRAVCDLIRRRRDILPRIVSDIAIEDAEGNARAIAGAIERTAESKDYQEGVPAFLEKRPSLFTGR